MSPTSYQAAPPRVITIAEVYCRVKFADQISNPDKDFRPIPIPTCESIHEEKTTVPPHSYLSATIGSTCMALRAGNNTSATPLNVAQSLGFTPYKTLAINRVNPTRQLSRKLSLEMLLASRPLAPFGKCPHLPPPAPCESRSLACAAAPYTKSSHTSRWWPAPTPGPQSCR
jgi:hypothetical protein